MGRLKLFLKKGNIPAILPDEKALAAMKMHFFAETAIDGPAISSLKRGYKTIHEEEGGVVLEKGAIARYGVYMIHTSILIILAGSLMGLIFGYKGFIILNKGETKSNMTIRDGNKEIPPDSLSGAGILSVATFPDIQSQNELRGTYAGWHVRWTPDGRIAVKANGGSRDALAANISRPIVLRRVVIPGTTHESAAPQGVEVYGIMTSSRHPSESPLGVSDTFSLDQNRIYCYFKLRGVRAGSAISSLWYFLGTNSPEKIAEISVTSRGGDSAQFDILRDSHCNEEAKRMPRGKYRIDILIDGKKEGQTYFRVQ
jgi:hypothetical protein